MRGTTRCAAHVASAAILLLTTAPASIAGQSIDVASLDGSWMRHWSNHDPNDQMRITISGGNATLVRVPATVHRSFRVGQQLWMAIAADGSLRVRGSDGRYYPARLTLKGSDEVHLSVQQTAAGDDQVWRRAGPTVDGDWVRIAPDDPAADGTRVSADLDQATVRFLPSAAGRHLRIGSRIWRGISAGGGLEILVTGARYEKACLRLVGGDSLWIEPAGTGTPQLWVRPAHVAVARAGVSSPLASASAMATQCLAGTPPDGIARVPVKPRPRPDDLVRWFRPRSELTGGI